VERYSIRLRRHAPGSRESRCARGGWAEKRKQTAAGIFSTGAMQAALANSRGLFATYEQTRSEFSITVMEEDSSGWPRPTHPIFRNSIPKPSPPRVGKGASVAQAQGSPARPLHCDP